MPTVSQFLAADFTALRNARVAWSALVAALEAAQRDAGANIAAPLRASRWFGAAADAAYLNLDRLSEDVLHATAQARLVSTLLDDMHELFHTRQQELKPLVAAAPGQYLVHDDGSVTYRREVAPSGSGWYGGDYAAAVNAPREHAAAAIPAIMKAVNEADARFAAVLRQLDVIPRTDTNPTSWQGHAQDAQAVAALTDVDLAAIPRDDPAAAAAWWAALTDDRRQEYIAFAPRLIGMTDGLPAAVRDQVNRLTLKQEKFELRRELDGLVAMRGETVRSRLPPRYRDPRALGNAIDAVRKRLDGVTALEGVIGYRLDAGENVRRQPVPPAFLLDYSTEGPGRAVVAIGDPDTADNVAISVPGTGSKLADVGRGIDRATHIQASAASADPTKQTSSILWMGYDAPQSLPKDATRGVFADNGAPTLARFDAGLDAARQGRPAHTTVIAHSYGSLVAGKALEHEGMRVDEFVIIGSPGVGADHVSELPMPAAHVYAGTAPNDPVDFWSLPTDFGKWPDGGHVRYGVNPASDGFGARDLPVDRAPGGGDPFNFGAHSGYWTPGSSSLDAMGRIIAGNQERCS